MVKRRICYLVRISEFCCPCWISLFVLGSTWPRLRWLFSLEFGFIDFNLVVPPYLKLTSLQVSRGCTVPVRLVTESLVVSSSLVVGIFLTEPSSYADFVGLSLIFVLDNGNDTDFSKLRASIFNVSTLLPTPGSVLPATVSVICMSMFTVFGSFSSLLLLPVRSLVPSFLNAAIWARCCRMWLCEFAKKDDIFSSFVPRFGWLKADFNGYGVSMRLLLLSNLDDSRPVELLFIGSYLLLLSSRTLSGYDFALLFRRLSAKLNCATIRRTSPGISISIRESMSCWMNEPSVATVTSRLRFWDSNLWTDDTCMERVVSSRCKLLIATWEDKNHIDSR